MDPKKYSSTVFQSEKRVSDYSLDRSFPSVQTTGKRNLNQVQWTLLKNIPELKRI